MLVLGGTTSATFGSGAAAQPHSPQWLALSSYESGGAGVVVSDVPSGDEARSAEVTAKPVATPREKPAKAAKPTTPQGIAQAMVRDRGWSPSQWTCLNNLWSNESGFRVNAVNKKSGAYGIPQALPATKMATAGADWRTSARTQIKWGLLYIADRYDNPCGAWEFWQAEGWY